MQLHKYVFISKRICIPRAYIKHTCKPPFHLGLENIQHTDFPKQNSHLSSLYFKRPFLPQNPVLLHFIPLTLRAMITRHFSYIINVTFQDDVTASESLSASYHIHMALPPTVWDSCSTKSSWLPTQTMCK